MVLSGYMGTAIAGGCFGILGGPIGIMVGTCIAGAIGILPFFVLLVVCCFYRSLFAMRIASGIAGAITGALSMILLDLSLIALVTAAMGFFGGYFGAILGSSKRPEADNR